MPAPSSPPLEARVVLLAAGASTRMGRPKQLLSFEGRPLLLHAFDQALSTGLDVDIVLGCEVQRCRTLLREHMTPATATRARILVNHDWSEGMASSVRLGVNSAPNSCQALLFMLCDQPRVPHEHFAALLNAWSNGTATLVASAYGATVGVPAVFGREHFRELLELQGDRGARALLARQSAEVHAIDCPEAALDLDRPEDLVALDTGAI